MHIDNKEKDIVVLGKGPTQQLDDTMITPVAEYPINFTGSGNFFLIKSTLEWKWQFFFIC